MKTIVVFCLLVGSTMANSYGYQEKVNTTSSAGPTPATAPTSTSIPATTPAPTSTSAPVTSTSAPVTAVTEEKPASNASSASSASTSTSTVQIPITNFHQKIRGSEMNHYTFQAGNGINMNENTDVTYTAYKPSHTVSTYLPTKPSVYGGWSSLGSPLIYNSGLGYSARASPFIIYNSGSGYGGWNPSYNYNLVSEYDNGGWGSSYIDNALLRKSGSYSYTAPDGTPISMKWTADENGFKPVGAHIPTPPPMPVEHAAAHAEANAASYATTTNAKFCGNQGDITSCDNPELFNTMPVVETVVSSFAVTNDEPKVETKSP